MPQTYFTEKAENNNCTEQKEPIKKVPIKLDYL